MRLDLALDLHAAPIAARAIGIAAVLAPPLRTVGFAVVDRFLGALGSIAVVGVVIGHDA
jgi:hypothetical protein